MGAMEEVAQTTAVNLLPRMPKAEHKNFSTPDERKAFPHGKVELLNIVGGTIRRLTLEPGWCWSKDNKPATGTEWCEVLHFQYQLSGRMHILMKDGTEFDLGPGDVAALPSGHDAWVIGSEPVVLVDWLGVSNYADT